MIEEPGFHAQAQTMAEVIDKFFNEKRYDGERIGFVLMVFPAKPDSRVSYLSNAKREDIVRRLRTEVGRFEQQSFSEGHL